MNRNALKRCINPGATKGQSALSDSCVPVQDSFGIWRVLWSMHSGLQELQKLCGFLRPKHLKPVCALICTSSGKVTGGGKLAPKDNRL